MDGPADTLNTTPVQLVTPGLENEASREGGQETSDSIAAAAAAVVVSTTTPEDKMQMPDSKAEATPSTITTATTTTASKSEATDSVNSATSSNTAPAAGVVREDKDRSDSSPALAVDCADSHNDNKENEKAEEEAVLIFSADEVTASATPANNIAEPVAATSPNDSGGAEKRNISAQKELLRDINDNTVNDDKACVGRTSEDCGDKPAVTTPTNNKDNSDDGLEIVVSTTTDNIASAAATTADAAAVVKGGTQSTAQQQLMSPSVVSAESVAANRLGEEEEEKSQKLPEKPSSESDLVTYAMTESGEGALPRNVSTCDDGGGEVRMSEPTTTLSSSLQVAEETSGGDSPFGSSSSTSASGNNSKLEHMTSSGRGSQLHVDGDVEVVVPDKVQIDSRVMVVSVSVSATAAEEANVDAERNGGDVGGIPSKCDIVERRQANIRQSKDRNKKTSAEVSGDDGDDEAAKCVPNEKSVTSELPIDSKSFSENVSAADTVVSSVSKSEEEEEDGGMMEVEVANEQQQGSSNEEVSNSAAQTPEDNEKTDSSPQKIDDDDDHQQTDVQPETLGAVTSKTCELAAEEPQEDSVADSGTACEKDNAVQTTRSRSPLSLRQSHPLWSGPGAADAEMRSRSSAAVEHTSSNPLVPPLSSNNSKVIAPPPQRRPKLLANLKPKSPHAEDELDEECDVNMPCNDEVTSVIGGEAPKSDIRPPTTTLPIRSSVLQFSSFHSPTTTEKQPLIAAAAASNHKDLSRGSSSGVGGVVVVERAEGDSSNTPYINKRSSLYVNSPDFSKKSQLVSPGATTTIPSLQSSLTVDLREPTVRHETTTPRTQFPVGYYDRMGVGHEVGSGGGGAIRPPVVMQLKGGDQRVSTTQNLSTLKMKPPDFSKMTNAADVSAVALNSPSRVATVAQTTTHQYHHQHQSPTTIDPYQFNEIRKKYNYISDLQLKPPSEPTTTPRDIQSAVVPSPVVGSSVTYPNLYVSTPEFTPQKFSGNQRPSHPYPTPMQAAEHRMPPTVKEPFRREYATPPSQVAAGNRQETTTPSRQLNASSSKLPVDSQYASTYGPMHSMSHPHHHPGTQQAYHEGRNVQTGMMLRVEEKSNRSMESGGGPAIKTEDDRYAAYHTATQGPATPSNLQYQGQVRRLPQHPQQPQPPQMNHRMAGARYGGESGAELNHANSVIKSRPPTGPLATPSLQHHGYSNSPAVVPHQEQHHQPSSGISLKQQQTDLLRTDLKRIHSPIQATSGNFMQNPPYSNMGHMNSSSAGWPGAGGQLSTSSSGRSSSGGTGYPIQSVSASPSHSRISVTPGGTPYQPTEGPPPAIDYYKQRPQEQHRVGIPDKYASTGDLSGSTVNHQVPQSGQQRPIVKHASSERYLNHQYGRDHHHPMQAMIEVKEEPHRDGYYGQQQHLPPQRGRVELMEQPLSTRILPPQSAPTVQLPLSNYPKFQHGSLTSAPHTNSVESSCTVRDTAPQQVPQSSLLMKTPTISSRVAGPSSSAPNTTATKELGTAAAIIGPRVKRESPLDLSVKTVKTKADSTGGFYEAAGYAPSAMRNPVKATNALKVNYVPNFGQHQHSGGKGEPVPGHSRQTQHAMAYPKSSLSSSSSSGLLAAVSGVDIQSLNAKHNYGPPVDANYQRNYIEKRPVHHPSNPSDTHSAVYPPMKSSGYGPNMQEMHNSQPTMNVDINNPTSQRQPPPKLYSAPGSKYPPGLLLEADPHYLSYPPNSLQGHAPPSSSSRDMPNSVVTEQMVAVERKRHADFAHLSAAGQQPAPKTMKMTDPYNNHQRSAVATVHYPNNVYPNKGTPVSQAQPSPASTRGSSSPYGLHDPHSRNSNNVHELPLSQQQYPNQHHYPSPVMKAESHFGQMGSMSGSHATVAPQDHKLPPQLHPAYRAHAEVRHIQTVPPTTAPNRYPIDVKMCYSPAPGATHPPHQQHRPSPSQTGGYPPAAAVDKGGYYPIPPNAASLSKPTGDLIMPMNYPKSGQIGVPGTSLNNRSLPPGVVPPPAHLQQQQPQIYALKDTRPPTMASRGAGADRNVISKLKTAIEEKQHQRLIQKQTDMETQPLDESKSDIASILAARIRTKGELKGYTGPTQTAAVEPKREPGETVAAAVVPVTFNPKERFDPPADMEGVSSFDLMDWGSACNDFVQQLQTGKKKKATRRRIQKSATDIKVELVAIGLGGQPLHETHANALLLPPESLVPREAIEAAAILGRTEAAAAAAAVNSDGSSDEDKPLVLIRQLSLERARLTESDTKSRCSSMMMGSVKSQVSATTGKGIKEKRLLQEKRYAARIANGSSSESEAEAKKLPKPVRRKKNFVKLAVTSGDRKSSSLPDPNTSRGTSGTDLKSARALVKAIAAKAESKKDPAAAAVANLKRPTAGEKPSSDSEAPVRKRSASNSAVGVKTGKVVVVAERAEKRSNAVKPIVEPRPRPPPPPLDNNNGKSTSDSSDSEALSKKSSKNVEAAKSLSDADNNKAGCSKESLTPTRTNKMRRPLAKDVGNASNTKPKAEEEHMTRSRKKQKLAEQIANGRVLRNNDKGVKSATVAIKARNKPGPKRKVPETTTTTTTTPPSKRGKAEVVVASGSSSSEEEEEEEEDQASEAASSSSQSDCETVVSARLRPRKAKALASADLAAARGGGGGSGAVEKKGGGDPSPSSAKSGGAPPAIGKGEGEVVVLTTPTLPTTKRGGVKRARHENKDASAGRTQDAGGSLVDVAPSPADEKVVRGSKKGRKNHNGDPQKFGPGWEDQLYEFKRSLKVPASLITIESPKWHRVSTSLPDLEPRSNSEGELEEEEEEEDGDLRDARTEMSTAVVNAERAKKSSSSTLSSIIDLVHQRVIWPIKRLAHLGAPSVDVPAAVVAKHKAADLLLPTPVLVKSTRSNGADNKDVVEHMEEMLVKNVLPRKTAKKSRTRREYNVEKNNEIIREIFGGEHRPASAPPGCGPAVVAAGTAASATAKSDALLSSASVNEYEAIVINKMSYEQKFEEYLGLYSSTYIPDETSSGVSNKHLRLAMSIDEAIKEDVLIFQRPLVQGEDPEHGGVVKRKIGRRGYTRRKGSSGFDYIRKKKRPIPVNMNGMVHCEVMEVRRRTQIMFMKDRSEQQISKEIKGWVLNKGVGESVLHKATRMNLLDVVAYCLIRLDMAPDQKDNAGYTPLHEACSRGHLDIARLLLQHGANATETSPSGIRPLHDAAENGDTEIVRLLLAYGADPKLATYAGQTPLDLAEDDEEMEEFLKAYLNDLHTDRSRRKPWRFEGAWKSNVDPDSGFNVLEGAPEVDLEQKRLLKRRRRIRRKTSGDEFVKVVPNTRKSSALNLTVKKLSNELNRVVDGGVDAVDSSNADAAAVKEPDTPPVCDGQSSSRGSSSLLDKDRDSNNGNSDEGEMFEFEECETVLPPVYFLKDEGADKWCMLTDLQNLLKFKSRETLLKQICPPNGKKEELVRDLKMNEFLKQATCLHLLSSGEKLNIRASKVSLIKYTDSVKTLLGVHTVVMRL